MFNEHDMSSDETETESQFGISKTVRRVRKHWIDGRVSEVTHDIGDLYYHLQVWKQIMRYIDQHYTRRKPSGRLRSGNEPHLRLWTSMKMNDTCSPKPGLPRNVYNANELTSEAIDTLDPREPVMLPAVPVE